MGSSPRVRGPRATVGADGEGVGLIPASAGTTFYHPAVYLLGGAHPRECGDHPFPRFVGI
ncbi:hypothetical protein HMPREF0573_10254 [Mobiluncus curtisii ATCC 43063]|nr:hypothetical protein HMPREF0573_10254 [Mobiluncus curtisii ATCC 43063]